MEKVKITSKEEMVFVEFVADGCKLRDFVVCKDDYEPEDFYYPLRRFTPEQFSLLLCGWYEVIEEYKVGDYLYEYSEDVFYKITSVGKNGGYGMERVDGEQSFTFSSDSHFEKVVETWKIALLNVGRKETKLQVGDIYVSDDGDTWLIADEEFLFGHAYSDFEEGRVMKYFPHEIGIEVKG